MIPRATRDVNNVIENKIKDNATLKELPKLIQTGACVAVAQRSLPFAVGKQYWMHQLKSSLHFLETKACQFIKSIRHAIMC